ncbi:MAG: EAL domain-containing protein [Cyanobacteria bacterium J06635_1]
MVPSSTSGAWQLDSASGTFQYAFFEEGCDSPFGPVLDHCAASIHKQSAAGLSQQQQLEAIVEARTAALKREIQERTAIEQQLFQEKELAQVTLHSIGDGVIRTDAQGRIEYLNPAAETLTGWALSTVKGRPLAAVFQIVDEATRTPLTNPVSQVLQAGQTVNVNDYPLLLDRDAREYGINCSAAPIHNCDRQIMGVVIVFRDVTQSRQLAQKLSWQANHDALTGLVNRSRFEHDITEALQALRQPPLTHILCYLDLDQFKIVNDTCGHNAGDELLRQVSTILKNQVRTSDIVARLGGDEFGILLKDCSLAQAQVIADALRAAVRSFRFVWEEKTFSIGVSIGLVTLDDDGQSLVDVMSAADVACYAAKESGRNRVHIYQLNDAELAQKRNERQWSLRIKEALTQGRFCLHQQLIQATQSTEIHQEILLRMVDEQGSLILPGAFMPAAERYGLMPEIDRWVIQTFLAHSTAQQSDRLHMLNLSGPSINDPDFCRWLEGELKQVPDLARQLCFEITETAAIANLNQAAHFMHSLKQLGGQFALDDFGGGMSCFEFLKELPIDYLKIDGKFIDEIAHDPANYAIVEAINHVGHVMGIKTIAEFVNTAEIRSCLEKIGVDYLQGYTIAKPQPLRALDPGN